MNDAAAQLLAQRTEAEAPFWKGALASATLHGTLVTALLVGVGSREVPTLTVAPVLRPPFGEVIGVPAPIQTSSVVTPQPVLKPPSARASRRTTPLPSSSVRTPSQSGESGGRSIGTSAPSGGATGVSIGDPSGATSPYSWYLAGVQAKVWAVWAAQAHPDFRQILEADFAILEDGSLANAPVVKPTGDTVLDMAVARAISSAAPFSRLPADMAQRPLPIRAHFAPED